jgi:hypothetical protein
MSSVSRIILSYSGTYHVHSVAISLPYGDIASGDPLYKALTYLAHSICRTDLDFFPWQQPRPQSEDTRTDS